MKLPEPKRKANKTKTSRNDSAKRIKKYKIKTQLVRKLSEGITDTNKLVSAIAKDNGIKRNEVSAILSEGKNYVDACASEINALIFKNALDIIKSFKPDEVQNSYKPLTMAILVDKGLKIRETLGATYEPTSQEKLLKFCHEHNMKFQDLKHIIDTGSIPEGFSTDLWKQLQSILKNQSPRTLDIENPKNP